MKHAQPFTISRDLQAPVDLLWAAQTEPEHLAQWMGPDGMNVIHTAHDFRAGGSYHYGLEAPDGTQMWGYQSFVEITPKTKIVLLQSFSDPDGNIAAHPMAPTWPKKMQATMTFESTGPKTSRITITWFPWEADQTAHDTFDMARAGMTQGFDGMFLKLDAHLAKMQA
jgi:uncharacterized protein YndB with AHSA1/START domain